MNFVGIGIIWALAFMYLRTSFPFLLSRCNNFGSWLFRIIVFFSDWIYSQVFIVNVPIGMLKISFVELNACSMCKSLIKTAFVNPNFIIRRNKKFRYPDQQSKKFWNRKTKWSYKSSFGFLPPPAPNARGNNNFDCGLDAASSFLVSCEFEPCPPKPKPGRLWPFGGGLLTATDNCFSNNTVPSVLDKASVAFSSFVYST